MITTTVGLVYIVMQQLSTDVICCHYLHQEGYVIIVVCLSVCFSVVSNFAQKLPNGFA